MSELGELRDSLNESCTLFLAVVGQVPSMCGF